MPLLVLWSFWRVLLWVQLTNPVVNNNGTVVRYKGSATSPGDKEFRDSPVGKSLESERKLYPRSVRERDIE